MLLLGSWIYIDILVLKFSSFFKFPCSVTDPPHGDEWQALDDGLAYGTDMVNHIRQEFGETFTICVAGK